MCYLSFFLWVNLFTHLIESALIEDTKMNADKTGKSILSDESDEDYYDTSSVFIIFNRTCIDLQMNGNSDIDAVFYDTDLLNDDEISVLQHDIDDLFNLYPDVFSVPNHRQSELHEDIKNATFVFLDYNANHTDSDVVFADILDHDELCIRHIGYQPVFKVDAVAPGCDKIDIDERTMYGLDLMTSLDPDSTFSYPSNIRNNIVDIYVLDTGINPNHVEFSDAERIRRLDVGLGFEDGNGHGTHVAGIAAGKKYGISKGFNIYSYKVCEDDRGRCDWEAVLDALHDIADRLKNNNRRGVINLSIGLRIPSIQAILHDSFDTIFLNGIIENGGIVVAAAGNEGRNACDVLPAASQYAFTVGSFNKNRRQSSFSNFGEECVDFYAPGEDIYSAVHHNNQGFVFESGTSMAAPYITGMIGNLLAINNDLTFDTINKTLLDAAAIIIGGRCDYELCFAPIYQCGRTWNNGLTFNDLQTPRRAANSTYGPDPKDEDDEESDVTGIAFALVFVVICCCCIVGTVLIIRQRKQKQKLLEEQKKQFEQEQRGGNEREINIAQV